MLYAQGGGTLILKYTRSLGSFFWVQNFEFQYFFGFSEKSIFFGVKDFVDIFWGGGGGHHKIGLYLGVISMHVRVFSKGQGTEWRYFFGSLKFQLCFGVLEIPDIFWG